MPPPFEPQNDLERTLMAASADPAARPAFYRTLLASDIYIVPVGAVPNIVNSVLPTGVSIGLSSLSKGGVSFNPFFSSVLRVEQFIQREQQWMSMSAQALLNITRGGHLVLNPGQPYSKEFLPDEIARLLDGTMFTPRETYTAPHHVQVLIGQPAVYPQELADALRRLFVTLPSVKKAYLAQYINPERDPDPGLLICIQTDGKQPWDQIAADAGMVASNVPQTHQFVDFVEYNGTDMTDYFSKQQPFYQRSLLQSLLR